MIILYTHTYGYLYICICIIKVIFTYVCVCEYMYFIITKCRKGASTTYMKDSILLTLMSVNKLH